MLNVNQSMAECYIGGKLKDYSIEWLEFQRGMSDPFTQLVGRHPNSTTHTPNSDIDYIYTYGIQPCAISTLQINFPATSNHLAIAFDLDLETFCSTSFSDMGTLPPRLLTSGNK